MRVGKEDIRVPPLGAGDSAVVLQRHEKYERDKDSERAGSLCPEVLEAAQQRARRFFDELLSQEGQDETAVFFVSSDTRYAKGYRSMETAQIAQAAAVEAMLDLGVEPSERIINLHPDFNTSHFEAMGLPVRPDSKVAEPKIFDDSPGYLEAMEAKYGNFVDAMAAHERDAEPELRQSFDAEGVQDVLARTKKSLSLLKRYAGAFHASNPNKRLLIWVASHYDTISPLVKDSYQLDFDQHLPVDYGGGVTIDLPAEGSPRLAVGDESVDISL